MSFNIVLQIILASCHGIEGLQQPNLQTHNFVDVSEYILGFWDLRFPFKNVYSTKQFQITFAQGGRESKIALVEVTVNSKKENSEDFDPVTSENSASVEVYRVG
jgi:hypothetical protein